MTIKETLEEKKSAFLALEPELKAEGVSDEVIAKGEALASEIEELTAQVERLRRLKSS